MIYTVVVPVQQRPHGIPLRNSVRASAREIQRDLVVVGFVCF